MNLKEIDESIFNPLANIIAIIGGVIFLYIHKNTLKNNLLDKSIKEILLNILGIVGKFLMELKLGRSLVQIFIIFSSIFFALIAFSYFVLGLITFIQGNSGSIHYFNKAIIILICSMGLYDSLNVLFGSNLSTKKRLIIY